MAYAEKRADYWRGRYWIAPGKVRTVEDDDGATVRFRTRAFARDGGHAVGCHAARVSLVVWCRCSYSSGLRWLLVEWRRRVL
jgi:hypothetical protein